VAAPDPVDIRLLALVAELGQAAVHDVAARLGLDPREVASRLVALSGSGFPLLVGVECDQSGLRNALAGANAWLAHTAATQAAAAQTAAAQAAAGHAAAGPPAASPAGHPPPGYGMPAPGPQAGRPAPTPQPHLGPPSVPFPAAHPAPPTQNTPATPHPPTPAAPPTPASTWGPPQSSAWARGDQPTRPAFTQPPTRATAGPPPGGSGPHPPAGSGPHPPAGSGPYPAAGVGVPHPTSGGSGPHPPYPQAGAATPYPAAGTAPTPPGGHYPPGGGSGPHRPPPPGPNPAPGRLGDTLRAEGPGGEPLTIQLVDLVDPADLLFSAAGYRLREGERAVVVHTELTNRGAAPFPTLPDLYLVLVAKDGHTVRKAPVTLSSRPPHRIGLPPGETAGGHTVYVLPENTEITAIRWSARDDESHAVTWLVES
jgi:hypothetical protein